MKLKSNEILALLLMVLALLLALAAWTFSPSLGITAFALFFIGAHLFYTERLQRRARHSADDKSTAAPSRDTSS